MMSRVNKITTAGFLMVMMLFCSTGVVGKEAEAVIKALRNNGMPIARMVVFTPESDPNELMGRPGGYISKGNFSDLRIAEDSYDTDDLGVDVGGSVEVFETPQDAERRYQYLMTIGKMIPFLTEYGYVVENVLLRLSKKLTPEQAEEYGTALAQILLRDGKVDLERILLEVAEVDHEDIQYTKTPSEVNSPAALTIDDFSIEEYFTPTEDTSQWYYIVIKNNSEQTVDVFLAVKVFNADGNIVGARNDSKGPVSPGEETLLAFAFDEPFETTAYTVEARPSRYEGVSQHLTYESFQAKNKEIIEVTNNGDAAAKDVEAQVLFFYDGKVVYHNRAYFSDADGELKPGKSIAKEIRCPEKYDSFKVYLMGRAR